MNIEERVVENAEWIRMKARRFYASESDAEDLAGETIYRCLNKSSSFVTGMSFKPWALTIMTNIYRTEYARRKRVMFTGMEGIEVDSGNISSDNVAILGDLTDAIRRSRRVSKCIDSVIMYAKGYSLAEIASAENIPVGTVKSRLSTGRKIIRNMMEQS